MVTLARLGQTLAQVSQTVAQPRQGLSDGEYAAFGRVVSGIEVVDEIAAVATDWNDRPRTPVVMEKVEIL